MEAEVQTANVGEHLSGNAFLLKTMVVIDMEEPKRMNFRLLVIEEWIASIPIDVAA